MSQAYYVNRNYCLRTLDRDGRRLDWETRYTGGLARLYGPVEVITGLLSGQALSLAALALRAMAVLLWLVYVARPVGPAVLAVTAAIAIFIAAWAPAANRADQILAEPSPLKILALPLFWLLHVCRKVIRKHSVPGIVGFLFFGGLTSAASITGIGRPVPLYLAYLSGAFNLLFAVRMAIRAIGNLRKSRHDHQLADRIERGDVECTSFSDMLDALTGFRTQRGLLLFLEDAKRRCIHLEFPAALRAMQIFASGDLEWSDDVTFKVIAPGVPLESAEVHALTQRADGLRYTDWHKALSSPAMDEIGKMVADAEFATAAALPADRGDPAG
jgi:hypothetical protein